MTEYTTIESEMTFGVYDSDNIFRIEESESYQKNQTVGAKVVEFVLWHNKKMLFLEAKKSTPNYHNIEKSEDKKENYHQYIKAITGKFNDSVDLYFSTYVGRQNRSEISEKLLALNYANLDIVFVVVIKNAFTDSLIHYKEKLNKELQVKMKLWNIKDLIVIDEEMARKKGLII